MTREYRFAFVSNSHEIGEAVALQSDPSTEHLVLRCATMEEAVPVARQMLAEGIEVILGGGGTGNLLAQTIGLPVVKIARSHLDVLRALMRAREYGSYIGMTTFARPTDGLEVFEQLLKIKMREIVFSTSQQLATGIAGAVKSGIDCLVGGGICKRIITSLGGFGIVVIPSPEIIEQALAEARAIAAARRREKHDSARFKTILETMKEGLIVVNSNGEVEILNKMAADVFGLTPQRMIGRPLPNVISDTGLLKVLETDRPEADQVRRVGDIDIVISSVPIKVDGTTEGVVATFKEAQVIQSIHRRLREKLYVKGFVAKFSIDQLKGESKCMRQLIEKTRKYAATDAAVLIEGETGTGKEILSHGIHRLSSRRDKPFVAINCSALPESLLESELFGYEEGAFTGAKRGGKIGMFELANGGTVFLDEIADISPSVQVRLLRVLEAKEIMRIGGDRVVPIDVRITSSTHKNLYAEVKANRFRVDLYFRLATLKLHIAPLRERIEDLPAILRELLNRYNARDKTMTPNMTKLIAQYDWPGNVRELDALVKRYIALLGPARQNDRLFSELLEENRSSVHELSTESIDQLTESAGGVLRSDRLKDQLNCFETRVIQATLAQCRFNKKQTAKRLGISVNTLWRKLDGRGSDTPHSRGHQAQA